jgi:16S rRNA (uracil1498-N3)-methyltransferase
MNQLFYTPRIENGFAYLDEEESRHLVTVLRRKIGDTLWLTDGKGVMYETTLSETGKKLAVAHIVAQKHMPSERPFRLHLAIAPTKQMERMEWFLEKATEIGVDEITLLRCKRSERETVRIDRLEKILVSAMKQSLRTRLPKLNELTPFANFVQKTGEGCKRIAWCADTPMPHVKDTIATAQDVVIAIGPEGDFSPEEVTAALKNGFEGVSLGAARLRTETAGLLAVTAVNLHWHSLLPSAIEK